MNAGVTPQGNRNAPYVQVVANEHVQVNPPSMKDGVVRASLYQMAQAITTKAQVITTQAKMKVLP